MEATMRASEGKKIRECRQAPNRASKPANGFHEPSNRKPRRHSRIRRLPAASVLEPSLDAAVADKSKPRSANEPDDGLSEPSRVYHRHLHARFRDGGSKALSDHELLELVLSRPLPPRDVKPLADALIAKFGSFAETIAAPPLRLAEVEDLSDATIAVLKVVEAAAHRLVYGKVKRRPLLSSGPAVLRYLRAAMAFGDREQFRVLFLDKRHQLIADEVQQVGTVDHTPVYPREVVKRALELSATGVILAHNHPSGDPMPSRGDIEMTRRIVEGAKPLGISVHDHIIIGKEGHASLRELGLI
jgi:DNA repair protein RadC